MTHLLAPAETRYLAVSTLLNPAESISDVQPPVVTAFTLAPLLTNILEICVWPSLALKCSGLQSEVALALGLAPELSSTSVTVCEHVQV